jgi:hypothetical protein
MCYVNRKIQKLTFLVLIALFIMVLATSWDASVSASYTSNKAPLQAETLANPNIVNSETAIRESISANESLPINESVLPDFIWDAIMQMNSNANSTELALIRAQTINQLTLNQERIADTNGAVLNYQWRNGSNDNISQNSELEISSYGTYDYRIDPLLWTEGSGTVYNNYSVVGVSDDDFTEFYAPLFWYPGHDQVPGHGQMASVAGEIWPSQASGDFYAVAKLGSHVGNEENSTNGNYLLFWTANYPSRDFETRNQFWTLLGYVQVTAPFNSLGQAYYVGTASSTFNYISVGVMNMGGVCTYNDVLVDCVWALGSPPESYNTVVSGVAWAEALQTPFPIAADFYVDGNFAGFTMYDTLGLNLASGIHTIEIVPSGSGIFHDVLISDYCDSWTLSGNPVEITIETGLSYSVQFRFGFAISASASIGGIVTPQYQTGLYGDTLQVTAIPDQSYRVSYWTINGEYTCDDNPLNVTLGADNVYVMAYFEVEDWDYLYVQPTLGGTAYIVNGTNSFPNGTQATVNVVSVLDGFAFSNWTINGNYASSSQLYTFTMTDNCAIAANFVETYPHHFLTVQYTSGGTAWSSSPIYLAGSQASVYASADAHYNFTGWTVDGNFAGYDNPLTVTMNADHTVVANFEYLPIVNFYAMVGSGPYILEPTSVDFYVDNAYVGAAPIVDFALSLGNHTFQVPNAIYEDGTLYVFNCFFTVHGSYPFTFTDYYENPANIVVQSDETYYAWYVPYGSPTSILTVSSSDGGHTVVEGGIQFADGCYAVDTGSYATVSAVADASYVFSGWTLNGWPIGYDNPLSQYMDQDYTLHAVFTQT